MKTTHAIPVIAALIVGSISPARADGPPTFELDGFPMTPHQMQTLDLDGVHEEAPAAPLTIEGMPASPHQLSVLRPRSEGRNGAAMH